MRSARSKRAWEEYFDAAVAALLDDKKGQASSKNRKRMVWYPTTPPDGSSRLEVLSDPKEFLRTYRMSLQTFNHVLEKIRHRLVGGNEERARMMAERSSPDGYVSPELRLSMTLRYLAGGSYIDIYQMHGVAYQTFYKCVWEVCDAIIAEFPLDFPIDDEQKLTALAAQFDSRGRGLLEGCVGALDGIAIKN